MGDVEIPFLEGVKYLRVSYSWQTVKNGFWEAGKGHFA